LRETRFALRSGEAGLTVASGRLAAGTLPGAAAPGLVADDGLSPDEGTGTSGRQLLMADVAHGPLTLALAGSARRLTLPAAGGLGRTARQDQLTLAASYAAGPLLLAAHASQKVDDGALLGTRLDPSFGLLGGETRALGASASFAAPAFSLRFAGTQGWVTPRTASFGLLRADGALRTRSWSATAAAPLGESLVSLRIAQPLALVSGRFRLANGTPLHAAVSAQETTLELGLDHGPLALAAYRRADAGNIRGVTDTGAAVRITTRF
jgi:hypothetical protein